MRTDAPDHSAVSSATHRAARSAGPVPTDGAGVFISARAVAREGDGRWLLAAESLSSGAESLPRSFRAALPEGTVPGTLFRFKARVGEDGVLRLGLPLRSGDRGSSAPRQASPVHSPASPQRGDSAAAALLSVIRAFGLSVAPGSFDRLARSVGRAGGDAKLAALLAAAAADKGLELSDRALAETAAAIDPLRDAGGDRGGEGSSGGGNGEDGRGRERGRPGRLSETPTAEAVSSDVVSADLVSAACESVMRGGGPLALMNGVGGADGGRWLFFPLRHSGASIEIRAFLRVLFRDGEILRLSLDMAGPSRYWFFDMPTGFRPGVRATVACDPPLGSRAEAVGASLSAALAPLGVSVAASPDAVGDRFAVPNGRALPPRGIEA